MKIAGIQKTTLVDFPGKIAMTIFTHGCNIQCPYCHNKQIAFDFDKENIVLIDNAKLLQIIEQRKYFIDAVVISGGEPTIQKGIFDFLNKIKNQFNLLIKLDTNGTKPNIIKSLIEQNLVDYFAIDIKTSFNRYNHFLGIDGELVKESYNIIKNSNIKYELRMTCYPDFINSDTINELIPYLDIKDRIFIQKCNIFDKCIEGFKDYNEVQLDLFEKIFESSFFASTSIRGVI